MRRTRKSRRPTKFSTRTPVEGLDLDRNISSTNAGAVIKNGIKFSTDTSDIPEFLGLTREEFGKLVRNVPG